MSNTEKFMRSANELAEQLKVAEAALLRVSTELQKCHEEKKLARVGPLDAGSGGRDLPRDNNQPSPSLPSGRMMCLAQEWHRDGRGLWAMRACRYYTGHTKSAHDFGAWRYNPTEVSSGAVTAAERTEKA